MSVQLGAATSAPGDARMKKVGIVVLNFNSHDDTLRCLRSLEKLEHAPLEIICVDNGSRDDSCERLSAELPDVTFIRNEQNLGFGGGVNTGFEAALKLGCEYMFCLNNDAFVDDPGILAKLLDPFEKDERTGVTGPAEYDTAGTRRKFSGPSGRSRFEMKASGAAFMISKNALETVGLLDAGFFLLYEDQDLFLRVERAGYHVQLVPDARFMHAGSSSTGKHSALVEYFEARNRIIFFARHWGISGFLEGVVKMYSKRFPRYVLTLSEQKRPDILKGYLLGIADGVIALPDARHVGMIPPARLTSGDGGPAIRPLRGGRTAR